MNMTVFDVELECFQPAHKNTQNAIITLSIVMIIVCQSKDFYYDQKQLD